MRPLILVSVVILVLSLTSNPLMSAEETYLKSKSDDGSVLILGLLGHKTITTWQSMAWYDPKSGAN